MAKKKNRKRKKLSAKQIKFFGTPAQKAALKRKRAAKRANPARKKKTKRIIRNAPKRAKRVMRKNSRRKAKRKNPVPEIISLVMGNPGSSKRKKGKKAMAKSRKHHKKRAAASSKRAGRRTKKRMNRGRRRNPGNLGTPMDWVKGGVGVIAGGVGTRVIPQFLGSTNTGAVGYGLNAIAALGLAFGTHALTKDRVLTASVAAGGFAALILRIVGDYTPYGQALSLSGFGDYMVSNFVTPQRIVNPRQAMFEVPAGWGGGAAIAAPAPAGADVATSGNNY